MTTYRKLLLAAAAVGALAVTPALAETKATAQGAKDQAAMQDEFLWLEEVEGEKAIDWAKARNEEAFKRLKDDPRFEALRADAEKILTAKDRIPYGSLSGDTVDNFWQDDTHVRGIWRRTSVDSYRTKEPEWETVLDLDALAKAEDENWVYKGGSCLSPDDRFCLLNLSRGGKDAVVVREYDTQTKQFVKDGFQLTEAKQAADWIDKDTLLIATDSGPDSMTTSGYPRQVKLWKRGTPVDQAKLVFEGKTEDMGVWPTVIHRPEGTTVLLTRRPDFFTEEWHCVTADGEAEKLNLPLGIEFRGMIDGRMLLTLRDDWTVGGTTYPKGALVAVNLDEVAKGAPSKVESLVTPTATSSIQGVGISKDAVYVAMLDNVKGKLLKVAPGGSGWTTTELDLPPAGSVEIVSTDAYSTDVLATFDSYLQPDTLYHIADGGKPEAIKSLPARFDATPFETEQRFATSKDGAKIPYFIVKRKDLKADGENPTLLYGYGGFEIAMTPSYLSPLGKQWIEAGGVWVVANIRGGGEFGPSWHQAALKENRQRAFDDFIAVAEDLVESKVTRPERLGIYGGSNGGLLMGSVMTQRPELFGATVIAVPLLDMLRYHTLLAGASWIGEYGNPEIPEERAFISQYSPYQKLSKDAKYPEAFIYTSTKDDRVHPGHARKFAAKMMDQGHPVIYFENIEGGHSAAANLKQRAQNNAMITVYLMQKLMDEPAKAN